MKALSAAIGDLDGNPGNGLEVVVGSGAWHADGTPVADRPLATALESAVLGDGGDGGLDTIAGARYFVAPGVVASHADGTPLAAYPKSLYGNTSDASAPVIGDFDGDGLVDVAVAITDASYGGVVAIWNMPGTNHDEHHVWPMLGHDVRHTGFYTPPAPDRPVNLSVGAGNVLAWEDRSAVEDAYVVERSATGAAWSYQTVAMLAPDSTSYAAAGGAYYRVRAARGAARSRPSNAVSVP